MGEIGMSHGLNRPHASRWPSIIVGTFILVLLGGGQGALMQTTSVAPDWGALAGLVGEWVADSGSGGQPGMATRGGETWSRELDGHVLVRRDFSEYPASPMRPALRHEGLTVFSRSPSGALRARFDDNEGHSIDYDVVVRDDSIVLTSATTQTLPTFRLTYEAVSSGYTVQFETAPPDTPGEFRPYASGAIHRAR
jgi:hypothetical protein